jgi:hypothetical protein
MKARSCCARGEVLATVQERGKFGAVMPVVNERAGAEDGFQLPGRTTGLVPDAAKVVQMAGDLAFVPGDQDRLDVGEVLVQRGTPDAGLLGNL